MFLEVLDGKHAAAPGEILSFDAGVSTLGERSRHRTVLKDSPCLLLELSIMVKIFTTAAVPISGSRVSVEVEVKVFEEVNKEHTGTRFRIVDVAGAAWCIVCDKDVS